MTHRFSEGFFFIKLGLGAFIVALLSACSLKTEIPPINTNPSDEIVIYGSLPADQALDLQMTARFESTNKLCGNFVDISHVYQLSETLKIKVDKTSNQYQARFFRDAIMKGKCDWALIYVSAELIHKDAGNAWRTLYNATPKDLSTKHLARILHNEEDHLFEVDCSSKPTNPSNSNSDSETSAQKDLDCKSQGMYLMPEIHRYNVNYHYSSVE